MKLEDGDIIEIHGKRATVCFHTTYHDIDYICAAFLDDKLLYLVYTYKFEGDKLLVSEITDPAELEPLIKIFLSQGLDEVGLPDRFKGVFTED